MRNWAPKATIIWPWDSFYGKLVGWNFDTGTFSIRNDSNYTKLGSTDYDVMGGYDAYSINDHSIMFVMPCILQNHSAKKVAGWNSDDKMMRSCIKMEPRDIILDSQKDQFFLEVFIDPSNNLFTRPNYNKFGFGIDELIMDHKFDGLISDLIILNIDPNNTGKFTPVLFVEPIGKYCITDKITDLIKNPNIVCFQTKARCFRHIRNTMISENIMDEYERFPLDTKNQFIIDKIIENTIISNEINMISDMSLKALLRRNESKDIETKDIETNVKAFVY